MSEKKDEKNKPPVSTDPPKDEKGTQGKGKQDTIPVEVNLKIENKSTEEILKILQDEQGRRKKAEDDLTKGKAELDKIAKELGEKSTESEDYKSKLLLIAREKFEVKKKVLMDRAAEIVKEPELLKQIGEGITDLEKLQRATFMIDTLGNALVKGSEADKAKEFEDKKKTLGCKEEGIDTSEKLEAWAKGKGIKIKTKEELAAEQKANPKGEAGTAPLSPAQTGEGKGEDGFESYEAMVRDLYRKKHGEDPEIAAEADQILDELFKKWSKAVKEKYAGKLPRGIDIEPKEQPTLKDMTKRGGGAKPVSTKKKELGD